jgi:hypothetical protein
MTDPTDRGAYGACLILRIMTDPKDRDAVNDKSPKAHD